MAILILAAVGFALAGVVVAYAQSNSNSGGPWCLNSCCFYGVVAYNTDGAPPPYSGAYGITSTSSSCASALVCHGYFWDSSISNFREVYSGWVPGPAYDCPYYSAPTTNAYGYHQIQYQGYYSSTYETHAN